MVSRCARLPPTCTIPSFQVLLGFDERPQPAHLLPLQLVQLGPHVMADKVQLFGQFPLLYVFHVRVAELFSEMLVFFQKIDDLPEVAVIVQPGVLTHRATA
uniref:Uncharacterized protein n=1 Tax=Anguilla anguilla TaxID=7936 RepID=A0A0E9S4C6_ANGAN